MSVASLNAEITTLKGTVDAKTRDLESMQTKRVKDESHTAELEKEVDTWLGARLSRRQGSRPAYIISVTVNYDQRTKQHGSKVF